MSQAYGLYTHIQSNRRRSILLLIGLFFLVYVMVFAGALGFREHAFFDLGEARAQLEVAPQVKF